MSVGSYSLSATAVYDSGSTVASTVQNVTVTALINTLPPPLPPVVPVFVQQNYATPQSPATQVAVVYPATRKRRAMPTCWPLVGTTLTRASFLSAICLYVYQAAVPTYQGNGLSQAIYYSWPASRPGTTPSP